jgi:hypothetical protein
LELPIDHFRLLGVGPTTDVQSVLRTLQQRLDRVPDQGFTLDTLEVRNTLLRQSADLLSDPEQRGAYESQLTALSQSGQPLQAALELGSNQEVGGLLLLHEAGQHLEVFELVNRALQPPQAPALGSGREADLCLLAGLSCIAGAEDLRQQRRYESAALLLGQGQQVLQRMGQQPQQRHAIADALQALRPYRVLDLLSRDLGAVESRSEGLGLLEDLVAERGGLEGHGDPHLSDEEFKAFFRQIRAYLTVQEQIDLFGRWSSAPGQRGGTADFLTTTALTASGFAQRKPDRIATARDRLLASGQRDIQPLLACLYLLLGQVDEAEAAFSQGASPELQSWARRAGEDPLAQLCAYCRDWLGKDVLPGYRDLEADPDLEAYFADRDVQAYLDELEESPPPPPENVFGLAGSAFPAAQALLGLGGGFGAGFSDPQPAQDVAGQHDGDGDPDGPEQGGWIQPGDWPRLARISATAATVILVAAGGFALLRPRPTPIPVEPKGETRSDAPTAGTSQGSTTAGEREPGPARPSTPATGNATASTASTPGTSKSASQTASTATPTAAATGPATTALPLASEAPSPGEVRGLLEGWLAAKAAVLAGQKPALALDRLARDNQIQRVAAEQRDDQARNQTQQVNAKVVDFRVESTTPSRIAAVATIDYTDQRLDADGQAVGQPTRLPTLRNRYVFARDGGTWRLVSFQRAE